jgi:predicted GNAT family acetyltransferase
LTVQVAGASASQRYEAVRDGPVLGFAACQKTDELVVFTHTEVDPSLEGQGVGGALVRAGRRVELGLQVLPVCPSCRRGSRPHERCGKRCGCCCDVSGTGPFEPAG